MKMNEEATFAVYQKKLKGICEENDLQATFNRSGYPLTMTVRPLQDVADQMSMLEKVEDNGYTSPDASIKFSYEDGAIKYTLSKEFVISDAYAAGEIDLDYALSVITSYRGLFKDVTSDAFLEKMLDEFVLSRPALEA